MRQNIFILSYLTTLCVLFASAQVQSLNLRVMSYNIHSGRDFYNVLNVSHIASVIKSYEPDIVGLQELGTPG